MILRNNTLVFSPSDLITYMASPFASWMDHYHLCNPGELTPDEDSDQLKMIQDEGNAHEAKELQKFYAEYPNLVAIEHTRDYAKALADTLAAMNSSSPLVYQAYLTHSEFAGWSDFVILDNDGRYQVWDTKLARKPKPYYAIQLCCYTEMLRTLIGDDRVSDHYGLILGTGERVQFRVADHFDYYLTLKESFLAMHSKDFTGISMSERPEPLPRAEHRRWTSYAEKYFIDADHLVQVAGMSAGNIKKLHAAGVTSVEQLAKIAVPDVPAIATDTLHKLIRQAQLQVDTRNARMANPDAPPVFDIIPPNPARNIVSGLTRLPEYDPADVYFDLEGYPLVVGGLEYLWGACYYDGNNIAFRDWWAHTSAQEKEAFESFIDWVYSRWKESPCMHIYHYAAYELNVVRRLSTRYSTRQDEVDELLRNDVFVDLYKVVAHSIVLGEDSYSIKRVERLYRSKAKRDTDVATAGDSIVQYARYIETHGEERPSYRECEILKGIRDYNEDDCVSTYELTVWLRNVAAAHGISLAQCSVARKEEDLGEKALENRRVIAERQKVELALQSQVADIATTLADVIDFHRREEKPMWWAFFDRKTADPNELWLDPSCIEGVSQSGSPIPDKQSLIQTYTFDASQECKLAPGSKTKVMFSHDTQFKCTVTALDTANGSISLRLGKASVAKYSGGTYPPYGSLIPDEYVPTTNVQSALKDVCESYLSGVLSRSAEAILSRRAPAQLPQQDGEQSADAALRIARGMNGDCLIIQGPPGTGKTYTAGFVINALLQDGKRVGITSNGHKAIMNLLRECGQTHQLHGIKVGGDDIESDPIFQQHANLHYVDSTGDAINEYGGGVVGGTAWLFAREEWIDQLDYLFIDEAGQVSLANALAMSRCARNIVLMGDQMQLEQPIKGSHPGDASLSVLQYYLKDLSRSAPMAPVFHSVINPSAGLFLGVSRRMHPSVCSVISDLAYEGRLHAHEDCARQRLILKQLPNALITKQHGIVFSHVEHEGNVQHSAEEVERIVAIADELIGTTYVAKDGTTREITLQDILFIAPYNAQVRALRDALGPDAQVGSVDKFQGLEAPVCILSTCSSYGEYGARGLQFILDKNRINVAISRAQCLAVVVGDARIQNTPVSSIRELELVNNYCRIVRVGIQ
jgi:uncharacterized protein